MPSTFSREARLAVSALRAAGARVAFSQAKGTSPTAAITFAQLLPPDNALPRTIEVTNELLHHLRAIPNIVLLDFSGTRINDEQLLEIASLGSVTSLTLAGTSVSDAGIATVAKMTNLTSLAVQRTKLSNSALAQIAAIRGLTELYLAETQITDEGLRHLKGMQQLKELDLSSTRVSDSGLLQLADMNLSRVWLNHTKVTSHGLVHFAKMSDLFHLELFDTAVAPSDLDQLRHLSNLQSFYVPHRYTGPLQHVLDNPARVDPVSEESSRIVEEILWWLPEDTESIRVSHGPFALEWWQEPADRRLCNVLRPINESDALSTIINIVKVYPVVLFLEGGRNFRIRKPAPGDDAVVTEGDVCSVYVFDAELGKDGSTIAATLRAKATTVTKVVGQDVFSFSGDPINRHEDDFICLPRPGIVLTATNVAYLEQLLARISRRAASRAFPKDIPEWKYVRMTDREWAIRHYRQSTEQDPTSPRNPRLPVSDPQAIGLVYSGRAGVTATLLYISGDKYASEFATRAWGAAGVQRAIANRPGEPGVVEIQYRVYDAASLASFSQIILTSLGHLTFF